MEQNIENKIETKDRINNFYNNNMKNTGTMFAQFDLIIILSKGFK